MSRHIVLWSGGADSTAVLEWIAGVSCRDYPIFAFSIAAYPQMGKTQLKLQNEAQKRYLAHAKKKGHQIKHQWVRVGGSFDVSDGNNNMAQPWIWLLLLFPCLRDGDTVYLGYIRNDCYWHGRGDFEAAFDALCKLKGIKATLKYKFEWNYKAQVLRFLKDYKVPNNCWHSCDDPVDGKSCGKCSKCESIAKARKDPRYKDGQQYALKEEVDLTRKATGH